RNLLSGFRHRLSRISSGTSKRAPRKRTRDAGLAEGVAQSQLGHQLGGSNRSHRPLRTVYLSRVLLVGETRKPTGVRPSLRAIARAYGVRCLTEFDERGAGDRGLW